MRTGRISRWELRHQVRALLEGRIGLQELDLPLADLDNLGFIDGRASIAPLLAEAQNAADRYYRRAFDRDPRSQRRPMFVPPRSATALDARAQSGSQRAQPSRPPRRGS